MNSQAPYSKILYQFRCGLLIMALTLSLLITVCFRIAYIKKLRKDVINNYYDDDGYNVNYNDYIEAKIEKIDGIMYMKEKAKQINEDQVIYNKIEFGTVEPSTFVIVIQVHDDITYLKALVQSLKYTMGITNSLLIFSHDFYDENINSLIHNISFAKFTQIFYPYNTQFYPDAFPGDDPNFCTNDFECEKSFLRSAALAQKKHYWWWQVNYVFDRFREIEQYNGSIVFLEEDQYVLKDFIFMFKVLESMMSTGCPQCEILSLGGHEPDFNQFHVSDGNLSICSWNPSFKSIGIGFNRSVWNSIKDYSYHFCNFNDYRWDTSLIHLGFKRPTGKFMVLASDAPRVIKYKKCDGGIYCNKGRNIIDVIVFARTIHRGLFPQHINMKSNEDAEFDVVAKGDWEDDRDRGLCMYFVKE